MAAMCYIYWRILDTCDDLLSGEEREKGLRIMYDRLQELHLYGCASENDDINGFSFSRVGPRDAIYISIVKTIDRLDSIFLQMDDVEQDVLLRFVKYQTNDFLAVAHSHVNSEQQYHEKCVTTIMTGLYAATFEVNRGEYKYKMDEKTKRLLEEACEAFETGNIIKDVEKDFCQGISYHSEVVPRGIIDEMRPGELKKVGEVREYLIWRGIRHLPATCAMFRNEWNYSYRTRLMALLLKTYLVKNYKMYWRKSIQESCRKSDTKRIFVGCLFTTLWDWEAGIMELDESMLAWRPNVKPPWGDRKHIKG